MFFPMTNKQKLSFYSLICFLLSLVLFMGGFIAISATQGDALSYSNSIIPLVDAFDGLGLIIIGSAFLLGCFLFGIKNIEMEEYS